MQPFRRITRQDRKKLGLMSDFVPRTLHIGGHPINLSVASIRTTEDAYMAATHIHHLCSGIKGMSANELAESLQVKNPDYVFHDQGSLVALAKKDSMCVFTSVGHECKDLMNEHLVKEENKQAIVHGLYLLWIKGYPFWFTCMYNDYEEDHYGKGGFYKDLLTVSNREALFSYLSDIEDHLREFLYERSMDCDEKDAIKIYKELKKAVPDEIANYEKERVGEKQLESLIKKANQTPSLKGVSPIIKKWLSLAKRVPHYTDIYCPDDNDSYLPFAGNSAYFDYSVSELDTIRYQMVINEQSGGWLDPSEQTTYVFDKGEPLRKTKLTDKQIQLAVDILKTPITVLCHLS